MSQSEFDEFMKVSSQYHLGNLPSEMPHPKTVGLAEMPVDKAVAAFFSVESEAIRKTLNFPATTNLYSFIKKAMESGGRLFLVGCGATGRLSLSIEAFYRHLHDTDKIVSFMAGGDVAFIRSIESFEDFPQYGARQLNDLGFKENDYLLGITEGGETPFVLGAVKEAANIAPGQVGVAYCNPTDVLSSSLERCREIFENPSIQKFSFPIGPMALSGSTRLQATTVLEYVVGASILYESYNDMIQGMDEFSKMVEELCETDDLIRLIAWEKNCKEKNILVTYLVPAMLGTHLLTDTTERSPTFCLTPFPEGGKDEPPSCVYLVVKNTQTANEAWKKVLMRGPRVLEWEHSQELTGKERLLNYNLSEPYIEERAAQGDHVVLEWKMGACLEAASGSFSAKFPLPLDFLERQMLVKVILNCHSTIMMGQLGRFESNIMTWVRPSNYKLIDRAIRYAQLYLDQKGITPQYAEMARACFEIKKDLPYEESIVLKLIERFS